MVEIFNYKSILTKIRFSISSNWFLFLAVFIYIIFLSTITILKHQAFMSSGFDLGLFNQAFWTTTKEGMLFYETADLSFNPGGSFFGVHFSPILFILLPFYAILPRRGNLISSSEQQYWRLELFQYIGWRKIELDKNSAFCNSCCLSCLSPSFAVKSK